MKIKVVKSLSSEIVTDTAIMDSPVAETANPAMKAASHIVASCFEARTHAHFWHLKTESFSQHKALEEFYVGIVELADTFAETFQGRYGIIQEYPKITYDGLSSLELISAINDSLEQCRPYLGQDTILQNIVDELQQLCGSTNYKLVNLK
jgi:DNA-binding ferritin-like protein